MREEKPMAMTDLARSAKGGCEASQIEGEYLVEATAGGLTARITVSIARGMWFHCHRPRR